MRRLADALLRLLSFGRWRVAPACRYCGEPVSRVGGHLDERTCSQGCEDYSTWDEGAL